MPRIPFPIVPFALGVPNIVRSIVNANVDPDITIDDPKDQFGINGPIYTTRWGLYDHTSGQSIFDLKVVSMIDFTMVAPTVVADFPVEGGSFANYDKIVRPRTPVLNLACSGSETDRLNFLQTLDSVRASVQTMDIFTQEQHYLNYVIQNYNFTRNAGSGVTMISVRIELVEVQSVTAQYTNANPLSNPVNPYNSPQVTPGTVQTQPINPNLANAVLIGT